MDKIDEARELLKMFGMPKAQQGGYLLLCSVGNGRDKARYKLVKCWK